MTLAEARLTTRPTRIQKPASSSDHPVYWEPFGPTWTMPVFQLVYWAAVWLLIWYFVGFDTGPPDPVQHYTIG